MSAEELNIETDRIPTIAEHVRALVAAAPRLTDEQIANIRFQLAPGASASKAA
ncbi:hypothetical protein [Arthrobacter sp. YC-RL1]|uniref:hypothetical protein n=1 Tax=Arthrobacter sp. YC-RL1 TaxID=1652545 RepID=UPI000A55A601|nr:hypothetical protein [Arthrobacter sp. YC-RL1]